MTYLRSFAEYLGGNSLLAGQTLKELFKKPYYPGLIIEQIYQIGLKSLPLVIVVTGSTGMVMALQFGDGLEKFGGKLYVPKIVSLSMVRELGPVLACLMIAARIGAGITSEIGAMRTSQQIDAIRALGTSPIKKIVIPRLLAGLIAIPLLSTLSVIIGVMGGLLVGQLDLGLDYMFYWQKVMDTVKLKDFYSGVGKSFFFAVFITMTACYYGLTAKGGTRGVGLATTKSVVVSSILIMIGDYFLTKLFLLVERWPL